VPGSFHVSSVSMNTSTVSTGSPRFAVFGGWGRPGHVAALFVLLLLLFNASCSSTSVVGESSAAESSRQVASGTPTFADRIRKGIKRGDEVTVTEKDGTVRRLRISKIDDEGIHGRDPSKARVTVAFDDCHSLAVQRGGPRESTPYRGGSGEGQGGGSAAKVGTGVVIGAGVTYLFLRSLGEAAGAALGAAL